MTISYIIEFSLGVDLARSISKMALKQRTLWRALTPACFLAIIVYANSPSPDRASLSLILAAIGYMVGWIITTKKPISFPTKLMLAFIAECFIALISAIAEHKSFLTELRSMYSVLLVTLICYLITLIAHELLWRGRKENNY